MKKNILIVDDSALMRRVLYDIIHSDDRMTVTGMAKNGKEAMDLVLEGNEYDGILLDIKMPKMNGLEFLEALKEKKIHTNVLIVSTIAKDGAYETIRALELGAFDFIQKPESLMEAKSNSFAKAVKERLFYALKLDKGEREAIETPKIKSKKQEKLAPLVRKIIPTDFKKGTRLVMIASSTGGPKTLQELIPKLPKELGCAFLIVQHMPEGFTKSLAVRLNEMSELSVKEAEEGDEIKNNCVFLAKGGYQMRIHKNAEGVNQIKLTDEVARYGLKPCADILLESLVYSNYEEIICVVLTGMGSDGTRGIQQLARHKKVYVIAQDEETSIVYGMPKVITETGLVNEILPIQSIAEAICKRLRGGVVDGR